MTTKPFKRASQILKELNIGIVQMRDYLRPYGITTLNRNTKISQDTERLLISVVSRGLDYKEPTVDAKLHSEFAQENPFSNDITGFIKTSNKFADRKVKSIYHGHEFVESIFTDFEAFSICLGLSDRHAKLIARNYFKDPANLKDRIEAHEIAMKALEKYGPNLITYVLSLPPLPFKAMDATSIFSELDKRRINSKNPIIRLVFKNAKGQKEKLQVSFFTPKDKSGSNVSNDILIVKNRTSYKPVMKINRSGYIIADEAAKEIIPVLELFVRFADNPKKMIINYGLETGECSVCGRPLSDPESVKRGIGPVCATL